MNISANAKAKGVRIDRLKTRDSYLIRKLKASGMTHRQIATIAKCSAGAVAAEMKVMRAENRDENSKISAPSIDQEKSLSVDSPMPLPLSEISLPIEDMIIELDFAG